VANTKKIQIKDLQVGMKIKTLDQNRNIVFKTVTDKWDTIVSESEQARVEFENGTIVNCSVNHPFMVLENGFIQKKPAELTTEDRVLTENGLTRLLTCDIGQKNATGYIDITVEDEHTFFASSTEQSEMVLTHNSQGGIRNASATITYPIWHYQFDDLIVLKNNQGTEETRVRHMDYNIVLSAFFWKRFKNKENITFFDPNEVPDLYEAFYRDIEEFEDLYVKYEKRTDIRKKTMSADEVFKGGILKERTDTGRIYLTYIDNVQKQGPFDTKVDPIYQSNLCQEILLPTKSFKRLDDEKGRISLCTLGSINWGAFRNPEDMRRACRILHRSLNNILDYQDFLSIQSKLSNEEIRPLGIGVTNLAYWHAKRNLKYGEKDSLQEVKSWIEHQMFYLTEASVELAKERGKCLSSDNTWYGKGVFPWERRANGVNELTDFTPELDWETLRSEMKKHGVRNATNGAIAPVESSSVVIFSTNGIEMPMSLISTKESKAGSFTQVVPEYQKLKHKYQLMWEQKDCIDYLKTAAVLAAYVDQSISTNTFYSPKHFKDKKVPSTLIAKNLMLAHKYGLKTLYYSLISKQGSKEVTDEEYYNQLITNYVESNNEINDESDCDSCKL
jgi:ribonucleoside-diphosphate reductase alpha chain